MPRRRPEPLHLDPREVALSPSPDDIARLTDAYFLRTKEVVRRFGDLPVTYAIFLRRPVICTPRLMVEFLEASAKARGTRFEIELMYQEGDWVGAGEPMIYVTG